MLRNTSAGGLKGEMYVGGGRTPEAAGKLQCGCVRCDVSLLVSVLLKQECDNNAPTV
jgi:hypothetical protein